MEIQSECVLGWGEEIKLETKVCSSNTPGRTWEATKGNLLAPTLVGTVFGDVEVSLALSAEERSRESSASAGGSHSEGGLGMVKHVRWIFVPRGVWVMHNSNSVFIVGREEGRWFW